MASTPRTYRLIASCPDRVGIVAAVSSFLAQHGGWIIEASQHADAVAGWFFMRYEILAESLTCEVAQLQREFKPLPAISGWNGDSPIRHGRNGSFSWRAVKPIVWRI